MAVKSLQDDMMDRIGAQIAKEIDDGIMGNILLETGWINVEFYFKDNFQAVDVNEWLNESCKDRWARYGSEYFFKDKQDAEWFILRWL